MKKLQAYLADASGAATVEFALALVFLTIPMLSIVDVGVYTYDKLQLENAGQMAAQTAWAICSSYAYRPVTVNCNNTKNSTETASPTNAQTAIASAVQQTALGSQVTVSSILESYDCVSSTGVLTQMADCGSGSSACTGTFSSPITTTMPSACATSGKTTWATAPTDYLAVTVSFTYKPMFPGVSVASLLPATMTKTTYIPMA
jgi:Flp pilus assembly protein TadG